MKFILPIIFILIAVLTFIFGVNPLYGDVSALRSEIDVYNTALNNSTNLQKTQDSLLQAYREISQSDKDRLDSFLPNSVDNIKFILEIEHVANLHSMPIKDIKFETIKKVIPAASNTIISDNSLDAKPYGIFPIEFTTEGDYASFLLFLKDLEHNLRLADVRSISFTVPVDSVKPIPGVNPNTYSYTLKVETYWLK